MSCHGVLCDDRVVGGDATSAVLPVILASVPAAGLYLVRLLHRL